MASSLSVQNLKAYMNAGLNIIITGVHGVGKTAKLFAAADALGLSVKYYSAATLDSFTDLTGIPVPNTVEKKVEYYRPKAIEDAEIIFFDEINRADQRTLNTILELILEHSVNGEPLPKLKVVVAAMNPVSDDYTTEELDKALLDRFDVFLEAPAEIDLGYFVTKYGDSLGTAAVNFWNAYNSQFERNRSRMASGNELPFLSPRRMDKIVSAFRAIPSRTTIADTVPPEITDGSVISEIYRTLNSALNPSISDSPETNLLPGVKEIIYSSIAAQRTAATGRKAAELLASGTLDKNNKDALLNSLASALNEGKSPAVLNRDFSEVIDAMSNVHYSVLTDSWTDEKKNSLNSLRLKDQK